MSKNILDFFKIAVGFVYSLLSGVGWRLRLFSISGKLTFLSRRNCSSSRAIVEAFGRGKTKASYGVWPERWNVRKQKEVIQKWTIFIDYIMMSGYICYTLLS
jgi:hypothetical protein